MSEIQQDALPTAPEWLEAAVADELANTIALRRHFHAEPELGNQETKTRDHIAAELRKYGVDEVVTGFGEAHTAVIGVLKRRHRRASREGKYGAPVCELRARHDVGP